MGIDPRDPGPVTEMPAPRVIETLPQKDGPDLVTPERDEPVSDTRTLSAEHKLGATMVFSEVRTNKETQDVIARITSKANDAGEGETGRLRPGTARRGQGEGLRGRPTRRNGRSGGCARRSAATPTS